MHCEICGHENDHGKFCEKCGARFDTQLEEPVKIQTVDHQEVTGGVSNTSFSGVERTVSQETAAGSPPHLHVFTTHLPPKAASAGTVGGESAQPNPYLESAKQNSKVYFDYFVKGLKSPLAVTHKTGSEQLLNGIISMVIFAILFPLMIYLSVGSEARNFFSSSPFVDFALKPAFWLAVFMLLIAVYTFGAVKISTNPKADLKEIIARFGTMLIPFIVISLIAFLFILMGSSIGGAFLSIALVGGIFTIPALITMSYKREGPGGLDTLYAILLIYVAIFLTMLIIGDSIGSMLRSGNMFGF